MLGCARGWSRAALKTKNPHRRSHAEKNCAGDVSILTRFSSFLGYAHISKRPSPLHFFHKHLQPRFLETFSSWPYLPSSARLSLFTPLAR